MPRTFFTADVKAGQLLGQLVHRLQQQGGFADARVAADEHHAAAHQATAQHPVKFTDAGGEKGVLAQVDFIEALDFTGTDAGIAAALVFTGHLLRHQLFFQTIPLAAVIAFALPFAVHGAAVAANEVGFFLGHLHTREAPVRL